MTKLSMRLSQLKTERNLLQKDIADKTNIPLSTYQRYEYGTREPNASTLVALAVFFDVSVDYLLGLSDDPSRH